MTLIAGSIGTALADQVLTEEQHQAAQTARAYYKCGWASAFTDGAMLRNELADSIAIAAAHKCQQERQTVVEAIQEVFPHAEWDSMISVVDTQFRNGAIAAAIEGKTIKKQ